LSTQKDGQPYASLLAFASADDLKKLFFLTPANTRKYENLTANPRVAMLVTNSRNQAENLYDAVAVTAVGKAFPAEDDEKGVLLDIFLKRHPALKDFASDPATAQIIVSVESYFTVSQFQNVSETRMQE
jgi:nitroimidazol reductase NimA-like FMN-containing flavoprotein (pyridoxamine 5'-phosphate oxidase superfamily)